MNLRCLTCAYDGYAKANFLEGQIQPMSVTLRVRIAIFCVILGFIMVRGLRPHGLEQSNIPLKTARAGFVTHPQPANGERQEVEQPPTGVFGIVKYPAGAGDLPAYITPNPQDGKKHPGIIWITGGDCNSIGDCWTPSKPDDDQTAAAYRKAGIVMMFPSLRGGNQNPGSKEGFYGEVDDVIAATQYVKALPYVDPERVYLGGHSTGGTLALLVAECSSDYRAVFAFGPVDDVKGYGADSGFLPFNVQDAQEIKLRSPGYWLNSVKNPTWVFEGGTGNILCLRRMRSANTNAQIHFIAVTDATHFSILAPTNALLARKIMEDTGTACSIGVTAEEANTNYVTGAK